MLQEGIILKSLSGFYEVSGGRDTVTCKARGKFRHLKLTPLVGDLVRFSVQEDGRGMLEELLPRRNEFQRPAVCNIEQLVIVASGALPVTEPFLIDRMTATAENKGCDCVICVNKWDLNHAEQLYGIYAGSGFTTLRVSAETGEGIEALAAAVSGKISAFTGNSGVGKSSILNAIRPGSVLRSGRSAKSSAAADIPPGMWNCTTWGNIPWSPIRRAFLPSTRKIRSRSPGSSSHSLSVNLRRIWTNAAIPAAPMCGKKAAPYWRPLAMGKSSRAGIKVTSGSLNRQGQERNGNQNKQVHVANGRIPHIILWNAAIFYKEVFP
jgi:hypothetical protein